MELSLLCNPVCRTAPSEVTSPWFGCTVVAFQIIIDYYQLGGSLIAKCHCNDIESIIATNELTNALTLSADRFEILYKDGRVLVSPTDKKRFVDDLKKRKSENYHDKIIPAPKSKTNNNVDIAICLR